MFKILLYTLDCIVFSGDKGGSCEVGECTRKEKPHSSQIMICDAVQEHSARLNILTVDAVI